ncbi:arginine--tRNA ligase [Candidatus Poriferisodalis sp.]|uniref:arginine--tRNA ligase n=1 Tax=Candidatus Poriferisodalis sp. TaxID=3101277 RepID=UPI003B52C1E6
MEPNLAGAIAKALTHLGVDVDLSRIGLERPARADHGDWSTNAALVNAKSAGLAPRELAQRLAAELDAAGLPHLERTEVAGPGFVNMHLAPTWLHEVLDEVLRLGVEDYGRHDHGAGQTVNLEFVSANPTGPLHAGGGRWGAYGDSLARLFRRCGYKTFTEYYVNDRGAQMELFGRSLAARLVGEPVPDDGYHGQYVVEWATELAVALLDEQAWQSRLLDDGPEGVERSDEQRQAATKALQKTGSSIVASSDSVTDLLSELLSRGGIAYASAWGRERALLDVRESLDAMNVGFEHWQSEAVLVAEGAMERIVDRLRGHGWVYEADGADWLRTSEFGDDKDRVLYRSDGEPTYFVPDIAYHHAKFSRGGRDIDLVIDVLGADHHGYVARMAAAMQMLGHPAESYEAIVGQNVTLMRDGAVVKLSKRVGTMVEVRELIDAVGPDVARFAFLLQSIDTRQTIDIDLLSAQASENPVFYVQYAHARIASVARRAEADGVVPAPPAGTDLSPLVGERELAVLRALEVLPSVVELALRERAPHKVTTWVRDLAAAFHGFYHDCPILRSDVPEKVRDARLCLTEGTRVGLSIGLDLLGVDAPEAM